MRSTSTFTPNFFKGTVSGPIFFMTSSVRYDGFYAGAFGDFVRFNFYSPEELSGLVEQVDTDTYVTIGGEADAIVAGSTVDVPFSGQMGYCTGARSGTCTGSSARSRRSLAIRTTTG